MVVVVVVVVVGGGGRALREAVRRSGCGAGGPAALTGCERGSPAACGRWWPPARARAAAAASCVACCGRGTGKHTATARTARSTSCARCATCAPAAEARRGLLARFTCVHGCMCGAERVSSLSQQPQLEHQRRLNTIWRVYDDDEGDDEEE
jgi:hypothetical protein